MGEVRRQVTIVNKRGLHARASAKFVGAVAGMDHCEIRVFKDGMSAAGGSILGLMMLGAAKGETIEVCADGPEAEACLAQLIELIEGGFGED